MRALLRREVGARLQRPLIDFGDFLDGGSCFLKRGGLAFRALGKVGRRLAEFATVALDGQRARETGKAKVINDVR